MMQAREASVKGVWFVITYRFWETLRVAGLGRSNTGISEFVRLVWMDWQGAPHRPDRLQRDKPPVVLYGSHYI